MRTTDRPPSRYDVVRSRRRSRRSSRLKLWLALVGLAVVGLCVLGSQALYVPPEAEAYWTPSAEAAEAAEARLVAAYRDIAEQPATAEPPARQRRGRPSPPPMPREVRITEADVNAWLASEAHRYADKARNVQMQFGDGIGTLSGIVELGGRPVHVRARGRLVRSADGTLSAVVDNVYAGRVPLGHVVARRLQREVDEELREHGLVGLVVQSVTMRPGEVILREHPPSS